MTAAAWDVIEPDQDTPTQYFRRGRWDEPYVLPPEGGTKLVRYKRVTKFIDVIEDNYNLTRWEIRTVARGFADRPDLVMAVNAMGPEPDKLLDYEAYRDWKKEVDSLCKQAKDAGKGQRSANLGKGLHKLTERHDRGEDLGYVPEEYRKHLAAYAEATKDFTAIHIETFMVCDELRCGGTPDRILQIPGHPALVIGDTKSGDIDYPLKMQMQLGIYAHSVLYNKQTGQRSSVGQVDQERGLIIALNAKTGNCDLVWIDIAQGWRHAQLAAAIHKARNEPTPTWPYQAEPALPFTPEPITYNATAAAALETGIRLATTEQEIWDLFNAAGDRWGPQHTEMAKARRAELSTLTA